jgi:hypothetical protein
MNTRRVRIASAGVLLGLLCGCENAPVRSAASEAAAAQARCTPEFSDAVIASVLDGSAVEHVQPIYNGYESKSSNPRLMGAAIVVRPTQGETAEWLDRALECHGSRQLAGGSASRSDPFWVPNSPVRIDVTSGGDGFRIEVTGNTTADAREILARAQTLGSARVGTPDNATAVFDVR